MIASQLYDDLPSPDSDTTNKNRYSGSTRSENVRLSDEQSGGSNHAVAKMIHRDELARINGIGSENASFDEAEMKT